MLRNIEYKLSEKDILNLKKYTELLLKWNKSINLIANSTEEALWERHVIDSLQLLDYINITNSQIVDLGSGAGMPALIMAIVDSSNHYTLVESNLKKCTFLNEVIRQLELRNVRVVNDRIEDYGDHNLKANIVTARGLAGLINLLEYLDNLIIEGGFGLFLKGENYKDEIRLAEEKFGTRYSFELYNSKTSAQSKIIKVMHSKLNRLS